MVQFLKPGGIGLQLGETRDFRSQLIERSAKVGSLHALSRVDGAFMRRLERLLPAVNSVQVEFSEDCIILRHPSPARGKMEDKNPQLLHLINELQLIEVA